MDRNFCSPRPRPRISPSAETSTLTAQSLHREMVKVLTSGTVELPRRVMSLLFLTEMPRLVSRLPSWLLQFMLPWPRIELKSSCKNFFLRNLAPGHNHKLAQLKTLKVCQEFVYRCIQYGLPHAFCLPAAALSNIALSQCKRLASDCRVGHLKRLNKNGWQRCSVWRSGRSRNRFYLKIDLNSTTSATHVTYTCLST